MNTGYIKHFYCQLPLRLSRTKIHHVGAFLQHILHRGITVSAGGRREAEFEIQERGGFQGLWPRENEEDYRMHDIGGKGLQFMWCWRTQITAIQTCKSSYIFYLYFSKRNQRSVVSRDCYLYSTVVSHIFFLAYFLGDASVIMPQHMDMWHPEAFIRAMRKSSLLKKDKSVLQKPITEVKHDHCKIAS